MESVQKIKVIYGHKFDLCACGRHKYAKCPRCGKCSAKMKAKRLMKPLLLLCLLMAGCANKEQSNTVLWTNGIATNVSYFSTRPIIDFTNTDLVMGDMKFYVEQKEILTVKRGSFFTIHDTTVIRVNDEEWHKLTNAFEKYIELR